MGSREKDEAARGQRRVFAETAARTAGARALRSFQDPALAVELKADRSVVTEIDRATERALRDAIGGAFPDDAIVGEELGTTPGTSGWTWYLDPIDGTQAYVRGVPMWGTLVAAARGVLPEVGVVVIPALGEMIAASLGQGCDWTRGMRVDARGELAGGDVVRARVSAAVSQADALVCSTWLNSINDARKLERAAALCDATGAFRGWGDCYGYVLVATGRAEAMFDLAADPWDAAPHMVCVAEAGGRFTDLSGATNVNGTTALATNGAFHEDIIALLRAR